MCINPIFIKNKSSRIEKQHRIFVPCGHCEACNKSRSDGMEYRAIKEYDWTESHGGKSYFLTMTYDSKHLPRAKSFAAQTRIGNKFVGKERKDYEMSHIDDFKNTYQREFYSHNKRDVQLFHKKLRSRLKYYGYDCTMSYFVVSEYGKSNNYVDDKGRWRKGTLRPHYHGMYNLIPNYPGAKIPTSREFHDLAFYSWGKCCYEAFKSPEIVNNVCTTVGYIAKYICKDEPYKEFSRRIRIMQPSLYYDKEDEILKCRFTQPFGYTYQLYNDLKGQWEDVEESQVAPFSLVSKDFGAKHLLHQTISKIIEFTNNNVSILNNNGSTYNFPCPRYYRLKFLYNVQKIEFNRLESIILDGPLDEYLLFEYKVINTEIRPIPEYEAIYNNRIIDNAYILKDKIFDYFNGLSESESDHEMNNFIRFGLVDYLLTRSSYVNFCTGEIGDIMLSDYVLANFFKTDTKQSRQRVEYLLSNYQKTINHFRKSKLVIMRENLRKRSAQCTAKPVNPFNQPNQRFNYVQKTKNPRTNTT